MNDLIEDGGEDDEQGFGPATAAIETRRLLLRAPGLADAPALVPLADNRRVAEQTRRMPHPYTLADAETFVKSVRAGGLSDAAFLVTRKGDGAVLGCAGLGAMDDGNVEIGYWIGEPFWGNGYATEAAQAVVDHAFRAGALDRLYGRCRTANAASRRVLVKCGFQYSGSGMCDSRALNGPVASEEFVLERSVWESLKRWGAV